MGVADPAVQVRCNLNSSVLREDGAGFTVVDTSGAVIVAADLA